MRGMQRAVVAFAAFCALAGGVSVATAATDREIAVAKRLFQEAEQHQKKGEWEQALEKLERVVLIKETAGVRFHIAVCHEKLGALVKALENYERAEKIARQDDTKDVLEMVGPELERMRTRVAGVSVEAPEGVGPLVVHVDQAVYANLPRGEEVRLDPGTHQVIVKIDGKVRLDRLVSVDEGQHETLQVRDWREPEVAAVQKPSPATAPPAEADVSTSGIPAAAWVSFGAGAALGIGGYLAYAKADALAEESADACAVNISCDPGRADAVRRWDGLALGMWVGAAVGVGAGIALSLAGSRQEGTDTSLVVSPSKLEVRTTF